MDYDVVIIGAGVVGLAVAQRLSGVGYRTLVIERHGSFGNETSSRNSEVIHAGIYYPRESLKAKLCVPGNQLLVDWCDKYLIPYKRTGKYIIAVDNQEEERLYDIYKRALDNGVPRISYTHIDKFCELEPNVHAVAAVWSPVTGIVDSHRLMQSYKNVADYHNCDFAFKHNLVSIDKIYDGYELEIEGPEKEIFKIKSNIVINSAGLDSDTVANVAGFDIKALGYEQTYCRGHYFRIRPGKKGLVNHLIYPVPPVNATSLGIHVTMELNGELKLGPDVQYLDERKQDYTVPEELAEKFFSAAGRYLKGLKFSDISPDQSGIRPKLQKEGEPVRDFIIKEESCNGYPGFINLIGIESPGLTCSLEIAQMIYNILR